MKTKEDILDELTEGRKGLFNDDVQVSFDDSIKAMQEYADQQTEQLKKQLEEKEKEVLAIKYESEKKYNHLERIRDLEAKKLRECLSQLSEKDKELSELKAKHKEEIDSIWGKYRYETNNEDAWSFKEWLKEYYTQTHGQ